MASNNQQPAVDELDWTTQFQQDMDNLEVQAVKIEEKYGKDHPEAHVQIAELMLKHFEKYPRIGRLVAEELDPNIRKMHANTAAGIAELQSMVDNKRADSTAEIAGLQSKIDDLKNMTTGGSGQQMPMNKPVSDATVDTQKADLEAVQRKRDEVQHDIDRLFIIFGIATSTPNFSCDVQILTNNMNMAWPFDIEDIRNACAEWLQCNDYVPKRQERQAPEIDALLFWLISTTHSDRLDHEVLAQWIVSAKNHFQNVKCLGLLYTALQNLGSEPQLSTGQTWAALRLLEFFVILDKNNMLTTQLLNLWSKMDKIINKQHAIPLVVSLWIKNKLFQQPLTRGQCLATFFAAHTDTVDLGDGIKAFQVAGAPDVFITDPADKIFKCTLNDIKFELNDDIDLVIVFKGYHRRAVLDVRSIGLVEKAFPDLDFTNRSN